MTTLRNFQDEIDNIHQRETAKQRTQAQISVERESGKKPFKSKDAIETKGGAQPDVRRLDAQGFQFDDDTDLQVCLASIVLLAVQTNHLDFFPDQYRSRIRESP